jgi:hypothetical protein
MICKGQRRQQTSMMTARKSHLPLPNRTPAFVSREVGAAELGISPGTWDRWVEGGVLPAAAPGFPSSTPRWRWQDVERKLSGSTELLALKPYLTGIEKIRGPKKDSGRDAC